MASRCIRLLFILFFSPVFTFAQGTATLSGKITFFDKEPIPELTVIVKGMPKIRAVTNSRGEFTIQLPADTTLTLQFRHISVKQTEKTIRLIAGEVRMLNIELEDIMLNTVDIEDKDKRRKFIIQIPIEVLPVQVGPSQDINNVLRAEIGVVMTNELSSGYSVRGGNYDENLVYVNDIEVYRPFLVRSGQQEGLSFANPDLVSSIFFSAGGFEAKYGDKMSSVMDITYKKPTNPAGSFSASLLGGSFHVEGASESRLFTWLIGARQKSSQYLLTALDTKGEFKPSFYDVQTFITQTWSEWQLNVLGNISSNRYHIIPVTRQSDFGTVNEALRLTVYWDGQEIDAYRSYMGAVSMINRPEKKDLALRYIFSAFHTSEYETFDLLGQYRLDALETDLGKDNFGDVAYNLGIGGLLHHARNFLNASVFSAEHKGTKFFDRTNEIKREKNYEWGIRYQYELIEDRLNEWKMFDSSGYSLPQGDPGMIELQDVVKSQIDLGSSRLSGYGQYSYTKETKDTAEISFTAGLRASWWELNGQFLLSPRASFAYKPNSKRDILLKAATGLYHQPPFYRELRDVYGNVNKDLKAQNSFHFLLGYDLNFKAWRRPFKFIAEVYYKYLDNLVPYEVDNVRIRYYAQNLAHGHAAGIDMKVNGEFVKGVESWFTMSVMTIREDVKGDSYYDYYNTDGVKIRPGYTTNDTIADSALVFPGFVPRPTDQLVTFGLFFQDYLPRLPRCKMHLNLQFGSGLPFGPPSFDRYKDTLRYPPYRRADIGFSYELISDSSKFFKRKFLRHFNSIWITAEVYNLFATNNTISYLWIRDVTNRQYAIPNYLSRRLINIRMIARIGGKKEK